MTSSRSGQWPRPAEELLEEAWEKVAAGHCAAASALFRIALEESRRDGKKGLEAWALLGLAEHDVVVPFDGRSPVQLQKERAEQALALMVEQEDPEGAAHALRVLVQVLPFEEQQPLRELTIHLARRSGSRRELADCLVEGAIRSPRVESRLRAERLEEALEIYRELEDAPRTTDTLRWLAIAVGSPERQQQCCDEAFHRYLAAGMPGSAASVLEIAAHNYQIDDPDAAEKYLRQAEALHRANGSDSGVAGCLAGLAFLAKRRGDLEQAERLQSEAVRLDDPEEVLPATARMWGDLFRECELRDAESRSAGTAEKARELVERRFFPVEEESADSTTDLTVGASAPDDSVVRSALGRLRRRLVSRVRTDGG